MDTVVLSEGIGLHPEARSVVERYQWDDAEYADWKRLFYDDTESFFARAAQEEDHRQLLLALFVRFAADLHEAYRIRGIGDDVYMDTFNDLQIWSDDCKRQFGEYGMQQYRWLKEHLLLRLFRLGRLQFQPYALERDVEIAGKKVRKHELVLNVHIPAGEPLDPGQVEASFTRAEAFFRGVPPVFVCHSWLLEPSLRDVLPPGSNILRFQEHFHIFHTTPESRQAEERIFVTVQDDASKYEERTALQRRAKAYLMSGNTLGMGHGIAFRC